MRAPSLLCLLLTTACADKGTDPVLPDTDPRDTDPLDSVLEDSDDSDDSDAPDTDTPDTDDLLDTEAPPVDQDADGSPLGVDCDDLDPTRTPGAEERCDGVDNDCDGDARDLRAATWLPAAGAELPLTDDFATATLTSPGSHTFSSSGTLLLCEGTHYVQLAATNDAVVTVRGTTTDPSEVVVHGGGGTPALANGGTSALHLRDLTLTGAASCLVVVANGANSLTNVALRGCGIRAEDPDATLSLTDVELDGQSSAPAPGLAGTWTSVTLLRVEVHHYPQGGLVIGTTGPLSLLQSDVHDNQSPGDGGGVSIDLSQATAPVTITLTGTTLHANHAGLRGGALYLRKPEALAVTLDGGHVRANTAVIGGAGVFLHQPGVEVSNLTLSEHTGGPALTGFPTGTWSNLTCADNDDVCLYTLPSGTTTAWTLRDSTLHRTGGDAINLSDRHTLTFDNVDFGAGADANAVDIRFDGSTYDYVGAASGSCALGSGCE